MGGPIEKSVLEILAMYDSLNYAIASVHGNPWNLERMKNTNVLQLLMHLAPNGIRFVADEHKWTEAAPNLPRLKDHSYAYPGMYVKGIYDNEIRSGIIHSLGINGFCQFKINGHAQSITYKVNELETE